MFTDIGTFTSILFKWYQVANHLHPTQSQLQADIDEKDNNEWNNSGYQHSQER